MDTSKTISIALNEKLNVKAAKALESSARMNNTIDPDKLLRAVNFYRQAGLLSESIRCLEILQDFSYTTDYVDYLHATLSSNSLSISKQLSQSRPRPFCVIEDVLSDKTQRQLLLQTVDLIPNSEASKIFKGYNTEIRNSLTISEKSFPVFASEYKQILAKLLSQDLYGLNLGVSAQEVQKSLELQMNVYSDGGFYLPHIDIGKGVDRKYTCVYYYYQEPKQFTGGDLLLYDDPEISLGKLNLFSRVNIKNNSLIIFESDSWHQVLPVQQEENLLEFSRFSLTCWLHDLKTAD